MRTLAALSLALPLTLALCETPDLFQDLDLEAARARAAETNLLVLIELESPDAALTEAFDAEVWGDAEAVRRVEVDAIAVRFGGAESDRLAQLWGVGQRPAILMQEPDGLELRRLEPPVSAKQFVRSIRLTVANRAVLSVATRAVAEAPDDVRLRMAYAEALSAAHMFRAAMVEFDRAWEQGRELASFEEDRLILLVGGVTRLVATYPKARGTLMRWRKRATAVLSASPASASTAELRMAAAELGSLNVRLNDADHSLAMYRKLQLDPALPPEVLRALFERHVFQVLYNQKDFEELLAGAGDLLLEVDKAFVRYEGYLAQDRAGELPAEHAMLVSVHRNAAIVRGSRYYETLLMTGNLEQAIELSDTVCNRLPRAETYLSLMGAAKRARARDELRRLGENGIALLTTAKDVGLVREAYDKNFAQQRAAGEDD